MSDWPRILMENVLKACCLGRAFETPLDAWRVHVALEDYTAHVAAWHAWRDAEFQRAFAKRKRAPRRPFNRT